MSLAAMTSALVNVTCADRIKIEDIDEAKESQGIWGKEVSLENFVSQLMNLMHVELGQDLLVQHTRF